MPGRKRSYSKSKLPYGIYQVAKSAARASQYADRVKRVQEAAAIMGEAAGLAGNNLSIRREAAKTYGKGSYTGSLFGGSGKYDIRKTLGKFAKKNKTGQMLYDKALGWLNGGGMYTGAGEYEGPESNDLLSTKSTMDVVPLFSSAAADDAVYYSRREYVSEIYGPPLISGSTTTAEPFVLQSFNINPGLEKSFPWLSQIASNFEEYELEQLCFTFKSTTTESGNQTNGQVGTIIMATNYNAAAANFQEKFTMMQYAHAVSGRLTESLQAFVECDPEKLSGARGEYIRTNPVVSNQDLKTYDHGKFQIAIANCTANLSNQSLGELWVSYTVKLRKPKFYTGRGLAISKDIFLSYPSGSETSSLALGTGQLSGQQNNIGILAANGSDRVTLTFPAAYSGYLKVMIAIDTPNLEYFNAISAFAVASGNIAFVSDLYGPNLGTVGDGPVSSIRQLSQVDGFTNPRTLSWWAITHINVQIATNGIDNILRCNIPTNVQIFQTYIEVCEYNSGFSYKANNIGTSEAPIWVNSSAVVTVP